ncbi:MAG: ATP-binding cassette domain-containing protein [Bacteroidota bacterium]
MKSVVSIERLSHSYPPARKQKESRRALKDISFQVGEGKIFCLLGPNGSGKSTLFRILSTMTPIQSGSVKILDLDISTQPEQIREKIGVVFQSPSLDKKLTAGENLLHQGHLYGLRGADLNGRISEMLQKVGVLERKNDLVETLSGGIQRRVELAKMLLHHPKLLLLDEPSTGLDPGARREFENYLKELRDKDGATILLTTHILDEAEGCDTIAIFDQGSLVAIGSPAELKKEIGGDVISITSQNASALSTQIEKRFGSKPSILENTVHIEIQNGHAFIPQVVEAFPGQIDSITLSKPTLEDVFIHKTGHKFWVDGENKE